LWYDCGVAVAVKAVMVTVVCGSVYIYIYIYFLALLIRNSPFSFYRVLRGINKKKNRSSKNKKKTGKNFISEKQSRRRVAENMDRDTTKTNGFWLQNGFYKMDFGWKTEARFIQNMITTLTENGKEKRIKGAQKKRNESILS
jgi:hypothetical protein